ncbi:ARF GTPase-activating protein GIT2-like isoform X2 [Dreissena polymorpha]|nr:ARF GTPase-activating protein GIT2-like isoform X2 [Dreissena polymorpha]
MSRAIVRTVGDQCADCGASEPSWASINRGVLICDECCSVHRSLGRHISQVKSLKKGQWCPTQLGMVQHLASHGANNIWEYSLWDPSQRHGRRKPAARDQVHPVKADFIRAKYQFLSFLNKNKDTDVTSLDDISQQLHSSVRTNNLETVLRLISKGADPNYYHPEKGNCPLHVAACSGQILQIELLVIYGADPGAFDAFGKTPIDYAKAEGHDDIASRLLECQYELTDRLAYYLCGKKPDHQKGSHFIIPEISDNNLDMSELAKQAKKKLQMLSNNLFEELAMDVYDEVDRRENDSVWLYTHDHTSIVSDRQAVPFLPVNPEFSATRNQGRQKLARFNAREFATLIIDILSDARRRQTGMVSNISAKDRIEKRESLPATPTSFKRLANSFASDDEPLYDSVASDEDYSSVDNLSLHNVRTEESQAESSAQDAYMRNEDKESTPVPVASPERRKSSPEVGDQGGVAPTHVSDGAMMELRQALMHSQSEVRQLIQANKNLQHEVERLNTLVHSLVHENAMLREQQQQLLRSQGQMHNGVEGHEPMGRIQGVQTRGARNSGGARPQSMFEPRNQERLSQKSQKSQSKDDLYPVQSSGEYNTTEDNKSSSNSSGSSFSQGSGELRHDSLGYYDNPVSHYDNPRSLPIDKSAIREQPDFEEAPLEEMEGYPSLEILMQKTERITKKIQTLLLSAQENNIASYGPCADNIHAAVLEMADVFPETPYSESVKCALHLLMSSAVRLQEECAECSEVPSNPEELTFDPSIKTKQVMQCAYDIAKSAKQLVTLFQ